jgi:hypothetical protein
VGREGEGDLKMNAVDIFCYMNSQMCNVLDLNIGSTDIPMVKV